MTPYTDDQWADICEFAGVWQRGQKCNAYFDLYGRCIRCGIKHYYLDPPTHDLPPPDQSNHMVRAWVAMECLRTLMKLNRIWGLHNDTDPADAIFATVAAYLKEQGQ